LARRSSSARTVGWSLGRSNASGIIIHWWVTTGPMGDGWWHGGEWTWVCILGNRTCQLCQVLSSSQLSSSTWLRFARQVKGAQAPSSSELFLESSGQFHWVVLRTHHALRQCSSDIVAVAIHSDSMSAWSQKLHIPIPSTGPEQHQDLIGSSWGTTSAAQQWPNNRCIVLIMIIKFVSCVCKGCMGIPAFTYMLLILVFVILLEWAQYDDSIGTIHWLTVFLYRLVVLKTHICNEKWWVSICRAAHFHRWLQFQSCPHSPRRQREVWISPATHPPPEMSMLSCNPKLVNSWPNWTHSDKNGCLRVAFPSEMAVFRELKSGFAREQDLSPTTGQRSHEHKTGTSYGIRDEASMLKIFHLIYTSTYLPTYLHSYMHR
jgi:hypothetical protein